MMLDHRHESLSMVSSRVHSPAFTLRARTDLDTEALAELWVASWQEAMPDIDFSARRAWFHDHIRSLEAQGAVTICAVGLANRLVGFVTLDPSTGWLDQLAVHPAAKGGGVATRLMTEARRLSPQSLCLDVNIDNPRALRFYEREGFTKIGSGVNPRSGLKTLRLRWRKSGRGSVQPR